MIKCPSCILRCFRAIANDTAYRSYRPLATPRLTQKRSTRQVSLQTAPSSASSPSHDVALMSQKPKDIATRSGEGSKIKNEVALRQELRYLPDPLKLANHVRHTLRSQDLEKALSLCRLASKDMQCIVSWNHCIDFLMSRGHVREAFKIYNEMKKRAQFPDSYTYVLLLRGFTHPGSMQDENLREINLAKAITLYTSMSAPNSRTPPSIIHTNAVLKVCAAAGDMDALWSMASKIPEKGSGSADALTYTTILNAVRQDLLRSYSRDLSDEEMMKMNARAVDEGRRVWHDIIGKWRTGDLVLDETLVCAMGRLLLAGKQAQDWDDVLSLIEQTMKIQRLVPRLGTEGREDTHIRQLRGPQAVAEEDNEGYTESRVKAFMAVTPGQPSTSRPKPNSLAWVQPGNNSLSLVMEACTNMMTPKIAMAYWDHFIKDYDLKPDLDNFHVHLRLLRQSRASAKGVELVRHQMISAGLQPRNATFRIAMSICMRDKKNHNVMDHASILVDLMEEHCPDLDVPTLTSYLDLALTTDSGPTISSALKKLAHAERLLRGRVNYGSEGGDSGSLRQDIQVKQDTIVLFRSMIGAIDGMLNRGLVPREDYESWVQRRSKLNVFVSRTNNRLNSRAEAAGRPISEEQKLVMRRESRQLRHFRLSERRRRKQAEGTWVPKGEKRGDTAGIHSGRSIESGGDAGGAQLVDTGYADSPSELGI